MDVEPGRALPPPPCPIDPLLRARYHARALGTSDRVATTPAASRTGGERRGTRANAVVLVLASVLGLWLGVAAPAVSPVAPPMAAPPGTPVAVGGQR